MRSAIDCMMKAENFAWAARFDNRPGRVSKYLRIAAKWRARAGLKAMGECRSGERPRPAFSLDELIERMPPETEPPAWPMAWPVARPDECGKGEPCRQ